ncbi:phage portal protein [Aedoeadaptatus acetigenes]|uniref:phage portal protein n=1 Tax=Aedoeadaptatus acetigenes TaxID=2981723 RepID=UPI0011DDDEE9|nr:phage portal protein [Aedoeadaptatus acetigenes]MCU6786404.1 phage portal protein [Aedoeadaptatus acetigenes]
MLQDEIRQRLGINKSSNQNDFMLWMDCYHGEYPWLGGDNLESLGLAASISSEFARLATIELESEIVNDEELNKIYQEVIDHCRNFTEYAMAFGGLIIKPYPVGDEIRFDFATPDRYVIKDINSHVIFIDRIIKFEDDKDVYYTRLEEHMKDGHWIVTNSFYRSENYSTLGELCTQDGIAEWAGIVPESVIEYDRPLFAYLKNPQANNLDWQNKEGVSCFARALSLIQDADEQYQRTLWEFRGSELAIDADVTVLTQRGELPHGKERLFRNLGIDQESGFYEVFSPAIRDSSLFNGLNKILRRIEFTVGLAYGTLSEVDQVDKTATEVKASKQRSYATIVDIQKEIQKALTETAELICFWLNKQEPDISFSFDDSLIVDSETEQKIRMQEVAAGLIKPENYLMWRYGISEEEARKMLPSVEETDDEDDETVE